MATEVRWRRGTALQHANFAGALSEITHETTNNELRLHDGATLGGHPVLMGRAKGVPGGVATLDSSGNVPLSQLGNAPHSFDYASASEVGASIVPLALTYLRTAGYSVEGDGGSALYRRVTVEPAHAEKVQSADGAWWEKVENDLAQFAIQKAFNGQPITIGMYGTSITYSQDGSATGTNPGDNGSSNTRSARPIPEELAEVLSYVGFNATVLNRGYPGDTTIEGLSRWESASPVDIAIIEYAHNDANNYGGHAHGPVSLTNYKKNLRQIATREIAKGAAVLFVGAPCEQSPNPANKIAMYIAAAREIAGELGAIFIDWGDSVAGLKNRYTDGVHLSVQANVNIAWDMAAHLVSYTPLMKKVSVGDVLYVSDGYARTTGNLFDWSDTTSKWDGKLIEIAPTQWLVAALDISAPAYIEFVSVNGSANATVIGLFYSNYQVVECPTYGHAPSDGPYKRIQTRLMTRGKHIVIVRNDGSSNAYIGPLSVRSAGEPTSDLMEKSEALSGIANPASLEICPAGWRVFCDRGKFLSSEKHGFKLSASIHVKSGEIGIGITRKIGLPLEQMLIAGLFGNNAFIRRLNQGAVVHEVLQVGAISGAGLYQIELLFSDGACKMFIDGANVLTEPFANLDGTPCVAMFDTFRGCVQAFLTDPSSRPDDKL